MSFDKHHEGRKDWRKPYHGAKAVDASCRSHGSCPWCENNRKHKNERRKPVEDKHHET